LSGDSRGKQRFTCETRAHTFGTDKFLRGRGACMRGTAEAEKKDEKKKACRYRISRKRGSVASPFGGGIWERDSEKIP